MENTIMFNTARMFEHACAFSDCARMCEVENDSISYRLRSHTVAGIVNSAFACEVFLKTLLIHYGMTENEAKGHELEILWNKLKSQNGDIATNIERRMKEHIIFRNKSFEELLQKCSTAFPYWRYIYEKDSCDININFLRLFREVLKETCCKVLYNKTWSEYSAND